MRFRDYLLDLFFTPRCVFCEAILGVGQRPRVCPRCNRLFRKFYLSEAAQEAFLIEDSRVSGRCLFLYKSMPRDLLHRFKYEAQKSYAEELARWMWEKYQPWIEKIRPDALIFVPLHPKRFKKRGYNQAEELCRELSHLSGVPMLSAVKRVINTTPQMKLGRTLRLSNMKGSMRAIKVYEQFLETHSGPLTFVIVDDIYTTGSTIEAIAEALQNERVTFYFWAAARSVPDEEDLDILENL